MKFSLKVFQGSFEQTGPRARTRERGAVPAAWNPLRSGTEFVLFHTPARGAFCAAKARLGAPCG